MTRPLSDVPAADPATIDPATIDPATAGPATADPAVADPRVDALTVAADASYEAQAARPPMDAEDRALAEQMIGRPLRGRSAAAVRCGWGLPAVLRVDPALDDGTPFPTVFWLACPLAGSRIGTIEASGVMSDLTDRVRDPDDPVAAPYAAAGGRYVAFRNALGPPVPRDPAAGGMPDRVKCLHTLYGHHLATGDNPVGAWVAERLEPMPCPAPCASLPADHADDPQGAASGRRGIDGDAARDRGGAAPGRRG